MDHIILVTQMQLGAQIKVHRSIGVSYYHHGIVSRVGCSRFSSFLIFIQVDADGIPTHVIHFTDVDKPSAVIQETDYDSLVPGDASLLTSRFLLGASEESVAIVNHNPLLVCYTGMDVVERARSRINERKYNVFTKNCEHFATWFVIMIVIHSFTNRCITGDERSEQVRDGITAAVVVGGTAAAVYGLYRLATAKNKKEDQDDKDKKPRLEAQSAPPQRL
jgi:hypothetical protein